jgi:hypothetical protein
MSDPALPSIIWLCGARAVGKSTVGYSLFTRINRTVAKSAYMDLTQVGFCRPIPAGDPHHHMLRATILAACWRNFRAANAHHLVVTGSITAADDLEHYRAALNWEPIILISLYADRSALAARIALRANGVGPAIPGDDLRGLSASEQDEILDQDLRDSAATKSRGVDDLALDTTDLTAQEAADALFARLRAL